MCCVGGGAECSCDATTWSRGARAALISNANLPWELWEDALLGVTSVSRSCLCYVPSVRYLVTSQTSRSPRDSHGTTHHLRTMSEYWKSTPSYWCKFCETYVRDTAGERKNHESTGKHQNNIQRSLRNLHKNQEREQREQQRAKDEVARLNGLVGGKVAPAAGSKPGISGLKNLGKSSGPEPPKLNAAAQRKAHEEQLVALGVELPEELKREVTGIGGWQTLSSSVVDSGSRSLADIKKEEEDVASAALNKGVHKRKAEDDEDVRDEEAAPKQKIWGNTFKSYPGTQKDDQDDDLDALLSGAVGAAVLPATTEAPTSEVEVKPEAGDTIKPEPAKSSMEAVAEVAKQEEDNDGAITAPPPVMFKKRKAKR